MSNPTDDTPPIPVAITGTEETRPMPGVPQSVERVIAAATTLRLPGDGGPLRALCLLPDRNVKEHDWSGAFRIEAARFAGLYRLPPERVVQIDVSQSRKGRLEQTLEVLGRQEGLSLLALFCHGWKGGVQLGPYIEDAETVANTLRGHAAPDLRVVLYACSAGEGIDPDGEGPMPGGEGGFADALRDALLWVCPQVQIDAHTVIGHTTRNPFVRRFSAKTAQGGEWIISPDSPYFGDWRRALHETDLRHRYPLMTIDEIRHEVSRPVTGT